MNNLPTTQDTFFEQEFFVYKEMVIVPKDEPTVKGMTRDEACKHIFNNNYKLSARINELENDEVIRPLYKRYCTHHRMLLHEHEQLCFFIERFYKLFPKFIKVSYKRICISHKYHLYIIGYSIKPSLYAYLSQKREDIYDNFTDVDIRDHKYYTIKNALYNLDNYKTNKGNKKVTVFIDNTYKNVLLHDENDSQVHATVRIEDNVFFVNCEEFKFRISQKKDLYLYKTEIITTNSLDEFLDTMSIFISQIDEGATETWSSYMSRKSKELMELDPEIELARLHELPK